MPNETPWRQLRRRRVQSIAAALLASIGMLLTLTAVPAVWLRGQLLDTDQYLTAIAPLGADPAVQDEVATKVATAINQRLDTQAWTRDWLPPSAQPLAKAMEQGVRQGVEQVTRRFTHSPAFERLWVTLNRTGHQQIVALLTGRSAAAGGVAFDPSGRLWLDLGPVIEQVKQELSAAGVTAANRIPSISLVIEIGRVAAADQVRAVGQWFDRTASWLPWLAVTCLLASIVMARDRRRIIVLIGLGIVMAMLALHVGLATTRDLALDAIQPGALSPAITSHLFDKVTAGLRASLHIIAALAGLTAATALAGPRTATRIRARLGPLARRAGGGGTARRAQLRPPARCRPW